jgi:hypothetical protein
VFLQNDGFPHYFVEVCFTAYNSYFTEYNFKSQLLTSNIVKTLALFLLFTQLFSFIMLISVMKGTSFRMFGFIYELRLTQNPPPSRFMVHVS